MVYMQTVSGEVFSTTFPEYHPECKTLKKTEGEALYRAQCKKNLLKKIKPGQKIYTLVRSVSKSGMGRQISLFIVKNGELSDITYSAAIVTGRNIKHGTINMGGCGMDMGFAIVYELGRALWPTGTKKPHGTRNGQPDTDGGYALKHSHI